jgi:hypothetical protein
MSADVALKKGAEEAKGLPTLAKIPPVAPGVRDSAVDNTVSNPQLETDRSKAGGAPPGKGGPQDPTGKKGLK